MTDRRIGFFWPLGARYFLALGVVVFAVTLMRTMEPLSWSYQEWTHTNGLFEGNALDLTGPIVAAFGAFVSGRLTPPSRLYALPKFSRDPIQFLAQSMVPAALVVTSAYILALVPVVTRTYLTATAGSLHPVNAASGLLILNSLLVVGWLIGLLAQSAFAAPVTFAAIFATTLVGYGISQINAVTPVMSGLSAAGKEETLPFITFRISFFFVVLVVALLTASLVLTNRDFGRRLPRVGHMLLWLLPAAFVVVAVVRPPVDFVPEANAPRICRDADGMEYCMHEAHEKNFDALLEEVAPIIRLVGTENLPFDRIHDWSLSDGSSPPKDPSVFYADASPKYGVVGARSLIANLVAGDDVCFARYGGRDSEQVVNSFMLITRLNGDREDRPDNRFGPLSDEQLQQWLTEHRSQVSGCDITDDLLP